MYNSIFDRVSLFQGLSATENALLRPLFTLRCETTGTTLFEQGDLAESLYVVVEGEVNIWYKPDDGPALIVARVRPGSVVGWSAALGSPTYTSSAVCATDCELLRVRGQDLRRLCEQHPDTGMAILERLATLIAERLRNTHQYVMTLLEQGLHIRVDKAVQVRDL